MNAQNKKIIYIVLGVVLALFVLLWYYQQQGLIKVFPTSQEREVKQLLRIDESRFIWPEGLTQEQYERKFQGLLDQRDMVLQNPTSAQEWFLFGAGLEFFNDHERAVLVWKKTLELQPQNFVAAHNIGNTYQYFLKDRVEAERYYLQALAASSDHTPTYQGLLDLYQYNYLEKQSEFEPVALQGAEKDPQNASFYYAELVGFFSSKGEWGRAREYLRILEVFSETSAAQLRDIYPEL